MLEEETNAATRQVFSLSDITESIARMFSKHYAAPYWIKAEISKLNYYPPSGHCFPDMVEKSSGRVKAQVRSIIWRDDLSRISQKFEAVTREPLREGIAIMFQAYVKFTSEHGLSLQIVDIEPLYTLGELAREKMATIDQLKKEGIYGQNKQLSLPLILQRVAIISAETSKGYHDLMVTLNQNPWGYSVYTQLFPALLQGEAAVEAIRQQLINIQKIADQFDAVAIIRGGGGEVGLACYDHYTLAREVALFPLPVISGIGHSTNETVVEMVANINKITPTDVAHFILGSFRMYDERIQVAARQLRQNTLQSIEYLKLQFSDLTWNFQQAGQSFINQEHNNINLLAVTTRELVNMGVFNHRIALSRYEQAMLSLPVQMLRERYQQLVANQKILSIHNRHLLSQQHEKVTGIEKRVHLLDPVNVLKRGFTITRIQGKAMVGGTAASPGNLMETETVSQKIYSTINETKTK